MTVVDNPKNSNKTLPTKFNPKIVLKFCRIYIKNKKKSSKTHMTH